MQSDKQIENEFTSGVKSGTDILKDQQKDRLFPGKLQSDDLNQRLQHHKFKDHYPSDENKYQGVQINYDKKMKLEQKSEPGHGLIEQAKDAIKGAYDKTTEYFKN